MQSTYPDSFLSDRKEELIYEIEETVSRYTDTKILQNFEDAFIFYRN